MDSLLRRVEHVESAFGQFDKVWEERWDRLESIVAWSRTDPATPTGSSSSGSALHDDSVAVSRIEALNADVFTAMDELFEKIMRLEERIGKYFSLSLRDSYVDNSSNDTGLYQRLRRRFCRISGNPAEMPDVICFNFVSFVNFVEFQNPWVFLKTFT